ncbi:MAG TPA: hypothetical protein VGD88_15505 [Opitutaceae bacterium]
MKLPATAQEWVHWLESGAGARWFVRGAIMLGLALLSAVVCTKQFRGPATELTLLQAGVGRQLAAGEGFTTPVNYPQTAAFMEARGGPPDPATAYPELAQPPLYALTVAAVLSVLGPGVWTPPVPPAGFGADYALLGLNVVLLWIAALQAWSLGARLFDRAAGALAAIALLVSAPIWQQTVAVNGTTLAMVLLLALVQAIERIEAALGSERPIWRGAVVAGGICGALFLTDYPAGLLAPLVAAYVGWRSGNVRAALLVVLAFAAVATPWIVRNVALTGSPVGLAWQDVALRAGDSTAEPANLRATLTATAPAFDLNKWGNKGLTALQVSIRDRVWGGGALLLAAFFVAGWLYRFRSEGANRVRLLVTVALAVLLVSQAFLNSGEGERHPLVYGAPLLMIFGAGFFTVLVASNEFLASRAGWAALGLLALQATPLVQDVLEPRTVPFHYPPYHPGIFANLGDEFARRSEGEPVWMADVPAGAAWYSGRRVWARPSTLRDFYAVALNRPLVALVLTPRTLDRPFYSELAAVKPDAPRFGDWDRIYAGLVTQRFPAEFPLSQPQKLTDNFYVLVDPTRTLRPGK